MRFQIGLGVILTLAAGLFYSLQTTIIKYDSTMIPPLPVLVFFQSLVSLALIFPVLIKNKISKEKFISKNISMQLIRTIFSLGISYLLFYAVTKVPLINAVLLANTAPLFVPLLGYLLFSHKLNHQAWFPLTLGFAGVVLVLHPHGAYMLNPILLFALGAGVCWAFSMLLVGQLVKVDSSDTTALYFFALSTIISFIISIKYWSSMNLKQIEVMTLIGLLYFLTQYTAIVALKYIRAQLVSVLFYANIIYTSILQIWLWNIIPSFITILGMVFIIIGGMLSIWVEYAGFNKLSRA